MQMIIDGLIISNWSREIFEEMKAGGITAANCTCSIWENFQESMDEIAVWKTRFKEHPDLLHQVYTTEDILKADREGKVGIILGWQNTSGIGERIDRLQLFHELGLRVVQLTYNTQNYVGTGCWESRDTGLTDFGREAISKLNELGILIDLSHCGPLTARETIEHSKQPVAYTHCCPMALKNYPRNKTDEELRHIVDNGGFVGFAPYPRFLPKGEATTVDDCADALEYVVNLLGEDHVGIGTDFTQDQGVEWFDWLRRDKGYNGYRVPGKGGGGIQVKGFERLSDYPNFVDAIRRKGWSEDRIEKIMARNWLNFLKSVWGR